MKTFGAAVCVLALSVGLTASPRAAEGEKVLFSFEKEEVEKLPPGKLPLAKFDGDGDFIFFPQEPMLCTQEKASAGNYSCKIVERVEMYRNKPSDPVEPRIGMFRLPFHRLWSISSGEPQANLLLGQLLNTGGWYNMVLPRDWSGYDLLRVDVCVETTDQVDKLMLEVEDALVEPPVSLTFDAPPAGKWVTLEMDLGKAAEERKLDVRTMAHIWVRVVMKDLEESSRRMHKLLRDPAGKEELDKLKFRAYVDNIRLTKKGTPAETPVLEGKRSAYTEKLPRSYALEEHMLRDVFPEPMPVPTEFQPAGQFKYPGTNLMQRPVIVPVSREMPQEVKIEAPKGPVELSEPSAAPIRDMIVKGCLEASDENDKIYNTVRLSCVAASDREHVLVGFYIMGMGSFRAGPTAQVPLGRWCTAGIATVDGKTWKGLDGKSEWPTVMGGNISKVPPRQVDLGGDIGGAAQFGCSGIGGAGASDYPVDMVFFVRSVFTGEAYWKSPKFFVSGDPRHCHNVGSSDLVPTPSGRIWGAWAGTDRFSSGRFSTVLNSDSTWVYWSDDGGATWVGWRGPGFNGSIPFVSDRQVRIVPYRGQVAVIGPKGWTSFDGKDWSEVKSTGVGGSLCDAVACGEEIYLSDESGPVKVYDGREWKPFAVPGRKGARGQIGVCGWKKAVFVEPDNTGKKLLMWQKNGVEWVGPKELVTEQKPIVQVRIQRYAPERFVPVAYMCASSEELPQPGKKSYSIVYGFNQYPPAGTPHEPWIKVLAAPVE